MESTPDMNHPTDTPDRITLHYRAGSSDKVYQAAVEPAGNDRFTVTFAYGRRGSTLQTGTKTASPVPYQVARAIHERLVIEKTAKGYTPADDGTPYRNTVNEKRDTGIACQLLNPIDETGLMHLLDSPDYALQEKFDGRRLLLRKSNGLLIGVNRLGLEIGLPAPMADEAEALHGEFILDGEAVGEILYVFDVLSADGVDLRGEAYEVRLRRLYLLLATGPQRHLRAIETVCLPAAKRERFERLRAEGREGAVFKNLHAPYTPGRPASGGAQLKYKFYETASCLVIGRNDKHSVALGLFKSGRVVPCGNVAVPAGREIPTEGTPVEVRYLYAFSQSGTLFQQVYLGPRDDIAATDCTIEQLKYKAA
jgi:bifunctional non-homologous end joining protein LigD